MTKKQRNKEGNMTKNIKIAIEIIKLFEIKIHEQALQDIQAILDRRDTELVSRMKETMDTMNINYSFKHCLDVHSRNETTGEPIKALLELIEQ